jgi:diguanylate cyclase (GGDEF)-like protein
MAFSVKDSALRGSLLNRSDGEIGRMERLERKHLSHWWNPILQVTFLIVATVVIFLPMSFHANDPVFQKVLILAVRGLIGLVPIFNLYSLYQERQIARLRSDLETQIAATNEHKVRAESFYELAMFDPLTGLHNRRFGQEQLRTEIARAERQQLPLVVILLDLDRLKAINDLFGHAIGDAVLKEFAHRLKKATRGSDIAVRMGGDEFLLILPECSVEKVQIVLSRLTDFDIPAAGGTVLVSSSRGWVEYQPHETVEEFLSRGDKELYANKAQRAVPA